MHQVIENLAEVDIGRAAQRHHRGKTDLVGQRPVQNRRADRAGLRNQRHLAFVGALLGKGGVEFARRPHDTETVRAQDPHAVAAGDFQNFALQRGAGVTALGETARNDQGETHTAFTALLDDAGNRHRLRTDDRQIDSPGHVMQRLEGFLALHRLVLRVDREQTSAKTRL